MDAFKDYLNNKGIRPSSQRLLIYDYLYKNHNHPTVENIYAALTPLMPNLSKTTVYNTLNLFVEKGIALVVNIDEHEARYDADTSVHGHFKCIACGNFFDVQLDQPQIKNLEGFKVDSFHINLKGYCKVCNNQQQKSKN